MANGVSRYRTLIEWSLAAVALTTIVLVMISVDSPVRQYAKSLTMNLNQPHIAFRAPEPIVHAGRTAWRICMDHQPLAAFASVAIVLVVFMRRMR